MAELDVVYGDVRAPVIVTALRDTIAKAGIGGTLYLGYPVIASADEPISIDALLVGPQCGVVAFLLRSQAPTVTDSEGWSDLVDEQDRLYTALETTLGKHHNLRKNRRLLITPSTVTVFSSLSGIPEDLGDGQYCELEGLAAVLEGFSPVPDDLLRQVDGAMQHVSTIKPAKKRAEVQEPTSRGGKLKTIEKEIANLDRWQKYAAIEIPEGPQRIRGLAGSGKTVVLALKAAYLHVKHPEWHIVVTFHSRALYQQLADLIRRFTFEHISDEPDWSRLRLMHSWGSLRDREGVYTVIAQSINAPVRDFRYAQATFGDGREFQGVCREVAGVADNFGPLPELFDAVLIDEAQDFPPDFFQLVWRFTRKPKRVVWAYDELQQLSGASMPTAEALFGQKANGEPRVKLDNPDGAAKQNVVLPMCYRNPPWTLTVAHALGFGIYRTDGLVQHFDDPGLWTDVGYRAESGKLEEGSKVRLRRREDSYPAYFGKLLTPADSVSCHAFESDDEQLKWLVAEIRQNLTVDELEPDDILIVLPNPYKAKPRAQKIINRLSAHSIRAHLAGVTSSRDQVFVPGSVSIAHIYRAKGNEAPMVYIVDTEHVAPGSRFVTRTGPARRRNILFTAITRSRAWVRMCGVGPSMQIIEAEFRKVVEEQYTLHFTVPTAQQREKMRELSRDLTDGERAQAQQSISGLEGFIEALNRGRILPDEIPDELLEQLKKHL